MAASFAGRLIREAVQRQADNGERHPRRVRIAGHRGELCPSVSRYLANDVKCNSFPGGVIPPGTHNYNIIVNTNCTVSTGATVNGNLIEPNSTPFTIDVQQGANVIGTIEEKGSGYVFMTVGAGDLFDGNIKEEGDGRVQVDVKGLFDGDIEEQGLGSVRVHVYEGALYNGNALEKDNNISPVSVIIDAGGDFNGNIKEEGAGTCTVVAPPGQPRGNVECD